MSGWCEIDDGEAAKAEGGDIVRVISIVDRLEGAADNFKAAGVPFYTTPQGRGVIPEDHKYSYLTSRAAAFMTAVGVWALPGDLWMKGYMAMANVFLVGACFTLAKTQRDEHESKRLANRLEDAKAEKLLMGIDR